MAIQRWGRKKLCRNWRRKARIWTDNAMRLGCAKALGPEPAWPCLARPAAGLAIRLRHGKWRSLRRRSSKSQPCEARFRPPNTGDPLFGLPSHLFGHDGRQSMPSPKGCAPRRSQRIGRCERPSRPASGWLRPCLGRRYQTSAAHIRRVGSKLRGRPRQGRLARTSDGFGQGWAGSAQPKAI